MTEKQKMLAGQLYYAGKDRELAGERAECKSLCFEHNNLHPLQTQRREELLRKLLGRVGDNILVEQPLMCDYGYNVEVGDNFFANHNCVILDCAKVTFGNNVMLGPNCSFYTAGHPLDVVQRNSGLEFALPITVGDDVWIGGSVSVMPGVKIGSGSVIGGGSVVIRDIPEGVVAAGNPCRVIRKITEKDKLS